MILHITTPRRLATGAKDGVYIPASLKNEGFIHPSTPEQVVATANRFYRGQTDSGAAGRGHRTAGARTAVRRERAGRVGFPTYMARPTWMLWFSFNPFPSDPDGYFFP